MEPSTSGQPSHLVRAAERPAMQRFTHPLNPSCEMHGISLSEIAGLKRVGFHLVRLPPGREANTYHTHTTEEEFYYVLSGRGVVEIDGRDHQVGPGDFVGFATPSPPHQLRNPHDEDLLYLVGGERRDVEVAELPRLGKHLFRIGRWARMVDSSALKPIGKTGD